MNTLRFYSEELKFQSRDRVYNIVIGAGSLAMAATGLLAAAAGEPIGILAAVVGTGVSSASFYEAGQTTQIIQELRARPLGEQQPN